MAVADAALTNTRTADGQGRGWGRAPDSWAAPRRDGRLILLTGAGHAPEGARRCPWSVSVWTRSLIGCLWHDEGGAPFAQDPGLQPREHVWQVP